MSLAPLPKSPRRASIFSGKGLGTAKLSLFEAVFFDRTKRALEIIEKDPEQINTVDPFAGLSTLHLAIFRQNSEVVSALCVHPVTKMDIEDRFGRKPIDMCVYTTNDAIFEAVLRRSYGAALYALENGDDGPVAPFPRR